jgi:hypothetical protein
MTVHSTGVNVEVFPDEFLPIMKAIRFAMSTEDFKRHVVTDQDAQDALECFLDAFSDIALNNAV